jgi:predicted nucleic acid-binding protein
MTFIIDASVTISWYLTAEASPAGRMAFEQLGAAGAAAPVLWWSEVRNALVVNERRGRLDMAATVGILAHLDGLRIRLDVDQNGDAVLALAREHRLTVYAAAYLELALRAHTPLATLDQQLARAVAPARCPSSAKAISDRFRGAGFGGCHALE